MKRTGYIFEQIYEFKNIKQAILKASLGKRHQHRIIYTIKNINIAVNKIQKMLVNKTYIPYINIAIAKKVISYNDKIRKNRKWAAGRG